MRGMRGGGSRLRGKTARLGRRAVPLDKSVCVVASVYFAAMASISTLPPLGSAATWKVERAGFVLVKQAP